MSSNTGFSQPLFGTGVSQPSKPVSEIEKAQPSASSTSEVSSGTGFAFGSQSSKSSIWGKAQPLASSTSDSVFSSQPSKPSVVEQPSAPSTSDSNLRKPNAFFSSLGNQHTTTMIDDLRKARELLNYWAYYNGLVVEEVDKGTDVTDLFARLSAIGGDKDKIMQTLAFKIAALMKS
ncbi:hypothetical protein BDZ45DRAFT_691892 [Acephala macrosclerotiorum]|nr:hypothetical protein BDZ45DRAFT_691892 [Acephala macrosclerotiorum]